MESQSVIVVITINIMIVPGLFWIGLEKMLHEEKWNKFVVTLTLALALSGITLAIFSGLNRLQLASAISLLFPMYHLWLYRGLRKYFIKKKNREPIDVAFNFKSGLMADRVFAIFFVLFSIFSSAIIVGPLIANYANNP